MTKLPENHRLGAPAKSSPPAAKRALGRPRKERLRPASREAQQLAAAILDVLAGGRTPNDAAAALGISPPRYYLLEQRALAGLVAACEPRPLGHTISLKHRMAVLEKDLQRARQECARQQALVRAAQRTVGLPPPPAKPAAKAVGKTAGKRSRRRRPVVRALKAAALIRAADVEAPASSSGAISPDVLQPCAASNALPSAALAIVAATDGA